MALPPPDSGSTALITGASSGIGEEFARQLAARGHNVFLVARREDRLRDLAAELERVNGVRAQYVAADLSDTAQVEALPGKLRESGLVVEILINNAGFSTVGDVHRNPDRQLGMVRVNIEALVSLTVAFLPEMTERGRGAVIQVASSVAFQPIPVQSVYSASKAFVLHFSEATAAELKGTGVTMTALCPGPVRTEFVEAAGFKKSEQEMAPSMLWSTAEEVAKAGLDAADKGKRVIVPGITNRFTTTFGRHGPRSIVLGPMSSIYRRTIGE